MLLLLIFGQPCFASQDDINNAKMFIGKFLELSHNYDPALIDMYSDNANIVRKVIHEDGKVEKVIIPTDLYKKSLLFFRLPAKLQGYRNEFINFSYVMEGKNVRATGLRKSNNTNIVPISFLLGKDSSGKFRILEEITETKSVFLIKTVFGLADDDQSSHPQDLRKQQ